MKIVVIGPGALGSLLAASLGCRTEHGVWLLDHDRQRAEQASDMLLLEEAGCCLRCPVHTAWRAEQIGGADLLLLCVKAGSVAGALQLARPLFSPSSLLVAFQNGISHLDRLATLTGQVQTALAVTTEGATLLAPGQVRHAGAGLTRLGSFPDSSASAALLSKAAASLTAAGFRVERATDILPHVWNKLLINVAINGLTVLHDCANGGLLTRPAALVRMEKLLAEAAAVARARGIEISPDPLAAALTVCRATADNISSMLQDVRRGQRTEIDAINGAVVAEAARLGIKVPENEELVRQIRQIETGLKDKSP